MADYKINLKEIRKAVVQNREVQRSMVNIAAQKLQDAKEELISDFESHPISQEIKGGADASNSSGTLGGYGNLFSFIGFDSSSDPVESWVSHLKNSIRIDRKTPIRAVDSKNGFEMSFSIRGISERDLVTNSSMPWERGRSWITAIERGISGFSYFIVSKLGRSGGGIQSKNRARSLSYNKTQYWTPIWKKFINRISRA